MSSEDVPMPPTNQHTSATALTTLTSHMNTDSRINKRTRPTSPPPIPPSQEETPTARNPPNVNAKNSSSSPNKRLNLERPPQTPKATTAATDQWNYLKANDSSSYTEVSSEYRNTTPPSTTNIPTQVNGVRTLDSGFKITATPAGGFPVPQLGESTWRNISQILKDKWPQKEGAKAWVRTYRAKYESNAQNTVAKLKEAITKIIGESDAEDLVVSTPTAAVELIERLPPPWHYLISGIPPEAIERLLRLQVCSSPEISCFFVPFEQPLPTYALTLENFSFSDSPATNKVIAEIVKDTIRSNPDVSQFIHENIPFPDAEAALRTVESVRVTSLTLAHSKSVKETVWNVYFDSPPAFTLKQYFDWTNILRSFFYISEDYGYATARQDAQFVCVGCKSFDHPTGLCPFPRIPGWFGPSTEDNSNTTLDNRNTSNHGRGAFNGNSNRGSYTQPRGHMRGAPRGFGTGKRGRGKAF